MRSREAKYNLNLLKRLIGKGYDELINEPLDLPWPLNIDSAKSFGNAHSSIDSIIFGNAYSSIDSFDSLGELLASMLIGQDQETGKIPAHKWGMSEEQLRNQRIEKYRRYGINKGGFKEYSDEPSNFLESLFKEGKIY